MSKLDDLKIKAQQIRTNELPESNTAELVGHTFKIVSDLLGGEAAEEINKAIDDAKEFVDNDLQEAKEEAKKEINDMAPDLRNDDAQLSSKVDDILPLDIDGHFVPTDVIEKQAIRYLSNYEWWDVSNQNGLAFRYDVSKYIGGVISINISAKGVCAAFIQDGYDFALQTIPPYADGLTKPFAIQGTSSATGTIKGEWIIPSDAKWLIVSAWEHKDEPNVSLTYHKPSEFDNYIKGKGIDKANRIDALLKNKVFDVALLAEEESEDDRVISTKTLFEYGKTLESKLQKLDNSLNGNHQPLNLSNCDILPYWWYGHYFNYKKDISGSLLFDVSTLIGKVINISWVDKGKTYPNFAFLINKNISVDNNDSVLLIDGTLAASGEYEPYYILGEKNKYPITIPNGAKYLLVNTYTYNDDNIPIIPDITFNDVEIGLADKVDFLNMGKKIAIFGGSWSVNGIEWIRPIWQKILGCNKLDDYGMGGAGFATAQVSGALTIPQQVDAVCTEEAETYDIYILWASTNDFCTPVTGMKIGTRDSYTDADNYDSSALSSQCGGINYCIKKISEKAPQAQIVFFSSCPIFNVRVGYDTSATKNIQGADGKIIQGSFADYIRGQKDCCDRFHVPFFDQWNVIGVNEYNKLSYFKSNDLRHMTEYGYKRLAYKQAEWLKACLG